MDLVAGAMGNLAPKLLQLLQDEYKLHKGVKAQVKSLAKELEATHVALFKVAQVPYDQLDLQVKLWASQAREASYEMEDILDTFLVRVEVRHQPTDAGKGNVRQLIKEMRKFSLSSLKARHDIARAIEGIKKQVDEMTERRDRYMVDDVLAKSATTSIDPRVFMTHTKVSELVGIDEPRDALIEMLTNDEKATLPTQFKKRKIMMLNMGADDVSDKETKIVSIVGSGGLGKTTLAKVVYEKLLTVDKEISCKAFVPVGRNPDLKKVFRDILRDLDKTQYMNKINYFMVFDEGQLIEEIKAFLKEKRYFIIIDDVWEVPAWKMIRIALQDNNLGSKIIITTRCNDVAELVRCTYKIQPLRPDSSKILFYGRIFRSQDRCPESFSELSDKILKKCGDVPLAIITIASLLANKSNDITEWQEVYSSIGSGSGLSSSKDMYNMRKILSLSYYDLPSHMKTCFLYLSMYPEDYEIDRDRLIWRWISEGFIQPQKKGDDLFELGKSYFNDLINRSLVQPLEWYDEIYACRVHDMILDLICSLSREENFVTTSDDIEQVMSLERKNLRRLSLKITATWPKKGVSQVSSIAVFRPSIDSMPSFSCLHMLRVLDLEGCSLKDCRGSNKLSVRNLIHLRYLGLRGTYLEVLPRGIEKLQFLQVLRMDGRIELPKSIFGLRQLMCLEGVHYCPRPGNLLKNLASVRVLHELYVDKDPAGTVEALGHLTQLMELSIDITLEMVDQSICDALKNSLGNLPRLQSLTIRNNTSCINWERWGPPPHLRKLVVYGIFSRTLPNWIIPKLLPHLTCLEIDVHTVGPEDIRILGSLPNLLGLCLGANFQNYLEQPLQKFVVNAHAFPRLRHSYLFNVLIVLSMFKRGAMSLVEDIHFFLRSRDFFSNPGGFKFDDLPMDHLPSLRIVHCSIAGETDVTGEEEEEEKVTELREALQHAVEVHPNNPELYVDAAEVYVDAAEEAD